MEKATLYEHIYNQCIELVKPQNNYISKLSTIASLLHHKMDHFFWTGFYLLDTKGELWVGPYQGSVACQKLSRPNGVCWAAIIQQKPIIVPDVNDFPGHIACDSRSKSEVAIPLYNKCNKIIGVLDVDSKELNQFDETDAEWLAKILTII